MKRWYLLFVFLFFTGCYYKKSPEMRLCSRLDWQSVVDLFPKTVHDIKALKNRSIAVMHEMLATLERTPAEKSTFHNTVRVYDNAQFKFIMNSQILSTLAALSTDEHVRAAAHHALLQLQQYQADTLVRNATILHTFQNYAQFGNDDQSKTISTRSFLQKSIQRLQHEGAGLSSKTTHHLHAIAQQITHLESQFLGHIAHDHGKIMCSLDELAGTSEQFIHSLHRKHDSYAVPLTYDAFCMIMENCTNSATRKKMFIAFNQRTYPKNLEVLEKLIKKRHEYAQLVGYKNFAEYESALQMIGSVQQARDFINDIVEHANRIVKKEFAVLTKELPSSVQLAASGKLHPWDEAFVKHAYRKQHYAIDAQQVAEYFPMDHVLKQLSVQFGQFFALTFEPIPATNLWSDDLICWRVRLLKSSEIIGYVLFDLYDRPGKSQQTSQMSVIPTIQDDCNLACSGLSIVVTNFAQAKKGQPTLLGFHDVKMLLHEFGHALHALFGATDFVDLSGTKGPRDFIELPSQLFEMWMDEPSMVAAFSQHYQTKKPLPAKMIQQLIAAEKFGRASLLQRQCLLSLFSLELGASSGEKHPHDIAGELYKKVRCDVQYDPADYFETSFDHLITYGSHYYGYVWSQVLAAELFEYICKFGITNPEVGQKLYASLLSHGGSKDPSMLITLLLGTSVTKQSLLRSLEH